MSRSLTRVILKVVTGVYQPDTGHTVTIKTDEGSPVLVATATESPASSGNYVATWTEQEKYGYWYVDGGIKAEWGRIWLGTVVGNVNYLTNFNVVGTLAVNGAFNLTGLMTINNSNLVTNFNADLLDGLDSTAFLLINNTGSIKHSNLQNLTYATSGHTGFESQVNAQFVSGNLVTAIINSTGSLTRDHAGLTNLAYTTSGHTGFAGTGVANVFTAPQTVQTNVEVTGSVRSAFQATSGSANLQTAGSSTTVTAVSGTPFNGVEVGAQIVANGLERYVTAKASGASLTINKATDWSAGYPFYYKNPYFVGSSDGFDKFRVTADGSLFFNGTIDNTVLLPNSFSPDSKGGVHNILMNYNNPISGSNSQGVVVQTQLNLLDTIPLWTNTRFFASVNNPSTTVTTLVSLGGEIINKGQGTTHTSIQAALSSRNGVVGQWSGFMTNASFHPSQTQPGTTIVDAKLFNATPFAVGNGNGTIYNMYGLFLAEQTVGVNKWGIFQSGSSDATANQNYFAGKVGIGFGNIVPTDNLHVVGTTKLNGNVQVTGSINISGSIRGNISTAPIPNVGAGGGTGATVQLTGSIIAGQIILQAGLLPAVSSEIVTLTFQQAFTMPPYMILTPANANAALLSGTSMVYVTTAISGSSINAGSVGLTASTEYRWMYQIIG